MCGIFGLINRDGSSVEEASLVNAVEILRHRGPDSSGFFADGNVGLAHVRLAIQDLSTAGAQPMFSQDTKQRYVLIYNGEIYNHLDIRKRLGSAAFRGTSDTETLLEALICFGTDILPEINGIFAFAFFDRSLNTILLARDGLGVKPLYILENDSFFSFSSEAKAFEPFLEAPPELDLLSVQYYLTFLYSPGSRTPLKSVRKLLPGHTLVVNTSTNSIQTHQFFSIPYGATERRTDKVSKENIIDTLDNRLNMAVRRQLLSDVPVGSFLSGGLDSSLLVAIAKQYVPVGRNLTCYTASAQTDSGSGGDGFESDLRYARIVAQYLHVPLVEVPVNPDLTTGLPEVVYQLDEPQGDTAPLLVREIAARARRDGTLVLLSGAGGDDLFSGYRRHLATRAEQFLRHIPLPVQSLLRTATELLPTNTAAFRRMRKFGSGLGLSHLQRLANYYKWAPDDVIAELFLKSVTPPGGWRPDEILLESLREVRSTGSPLNDMLYLDTRYFLADHNLNYTDKAGMAEGVEIRVPYLDLEVVKFASTIPPSLKLHNGDLKHCLKLVGERYLPKDVIYRSKVGFGAPLRDWFQGPLRGWLHSELSPDRVNRTGVFSPTAIQTLIARHSARELDVAHLLLAIISFHRWHDFFVSTERNAAAQL